MKKILRILIEITIDALYSVLYFIENNLNNFATILNTILPYLMWFIGQEVALNRGNFSAGGEIFVPLLFMVVIYYLRNSANKLGKGITIPLPENRFTQVDDDGEVSIENRRIQELLLYVANLEDWLEKKGML